MKRQQKISIAIVSILTLALILLAAYYSDFLGARFITKGSPRVTVRQGEINTLELSHSDRTRKLEICMEKRNIFLGRSDFIECRSLKDFVAPGTTEAAVIIPANMPLGRAIVITRIRNDNGTLAPLVPTDEKIALYIVPPTGSILTAGGGDSTGSGSSSGTGGGSGGESGSGSGATGGGSGAGSGGGSAATPTPTSAQKSPLPTVEPSPIQTIIFPTTSPAVSPTPTFIFPSPSPIFVSPSPSPTSFIFCTDQEPSEVPLVGASKAELALANLSLTPSYMVSGTPATVSFDVKNIGPATASKFYVEILYDKYWNSFYDPHTGNSQNTEYDLRFGKYFEVGSLASGQTTRITHTITNTVSSSAPPVNQVQHSIRISVNQPEDYNTPFPEEYTYANNGGYCLFRPNL